MANNNFVVQNGLTVGPLTIDASTGSITTTGAIATSGASPRISQNASNVIATANFVNVAVNGANIASFGAGGLNLLSVGLYAGGTTGAAGQVLKSTGSGISWASADQILNGASNVRVTSDWVNVAINSSNVLTVGGAYSSVTGYLNVSGNIIAAVAELGAIETAGGITANSTTAGSSSAGAILTSGGISVAKDSYFGASLIIQGNLFVNGNVTTFNANNLSINDSLIYLADDNPGDILDIGIISSFTNPGYQHTGFVRDASDAVWKLFANVTTEPTTTVDFTNAIYQPILTGTHTISSGFLNVGGNILSTGAVLNSLTVNGNESVTGYLNVTGNVLTAALITSTATVNSTSTFNGAPTINAQLNTRDVIPNASNTYSVGSTTNWYSSFWGKAVNAQYADLAEKYQADAEYAPGTVLMFGGSAEVTLADSETQRVAGVVSTDPAYLMNGLLNGENTVALALTGRVPCRVTGTIRKGDMLTSSGNGFAHANPEPKLGAVIGKALEDFDGLEGVIEVVVGRL